MVKPQGRMPQQFMLVCKKGWRVMLRPEDQALLGIPVSVATPQRASAISLVIRASSEERTGLESWNLSGLPGGSSPFRVRVASDRKTRERAYQLAYRLYQRSGYIPLVEDGRIVSAHDLQPNTLTLLAEDPDREEIATVSLFFDSKMGLPCDEIYGQELNVLRSQGRRLVEVTRLAISAEHLHSQMLLVRLFNFIYVFSRRVQGFDDFVIEVNPRHVNYYRRLLMFERIGPKRLCPRVNGAPAVLLRLDLSVPEREVRRVGGKGVAANERTLYPQFCTWLEERAVAEYLAYSHKPMTSDDARYFGLEVDPFQTDFTLTSASH